jgi:KDO2-lipid IV(A) lauroyltransferase
MADRLSALRNVLWFLDALVIGGLIVLLGWLPLDRASATGRRMGMWLGPRMSDRSRKFRRNLSLAFPKKNPAEIQALLREVWGNAGAVFAEFPHLGEIAKCNGTDRLEIEVADEIRVFKDPTKPAIFVAAHLANWELNAAAVVCRGVPMTAVYSPPANPWLDRLLVRWRRPLGCRLVARQESMRPLIRELQGGRSIGLVLDQRVDSGRMIPFFGMDKATTIIPARLALRFGCELVPMRTERLQDARYRVSFYPPISPDSAEGDEVTRATEMMRKVNQLFEDWIRAAPQDWFCSKRRWPKDAKPPADLDATMESEEPPRRQEKLIE